MKTKKKKDPKYNLDFKFEVEATDERADICGLNGQTKGSMIAKGWPSNYCEFTLHDKAKTKGCVTYVGSIMVIEIGESHRFKVDLQSLISEAATKAGYESE